MNPGVSAIGSSVPQGIQTPLEQSSTSDTSREEAENFDQQFSTGSTATSQAKGPAETPLTTASTGGTDPSSTAALQAQLHQGFVMNMVTFGMQQSKEFIQNIEQNDQGNS